MAGQQALCVGAVQCESMKWLGKAIILVLLIVPAIIVVVFLIPLSGLCLIGDAVSRRIAARKLRRRMHRAGRVISWAELEERLRADVNGARVAARSGGRIVVAGSADVRGGLAIADLHAAVPVPVVGTLARVVNGMGSFNDSDGAVWWVSRSVVEWAKSEGVSGVDDAIEGLKPEQMLLRRLQQPDFDRWCVWKPLDVETGPALYVAAFYGACGERAARDRIHALKQRNPEVESVVVFTGIASLREEERLMFLRAVEEEGPRSRDQR